MTNQSGMVQKDTGFLLEGLQKGLAFLFLDLPFHPPTDSSPWGAWSLTSLLKGGGNLRPNILTPVFSPDGANRSHSCSPLSTVKPAAVAEATEQPEAEEWES